MPHQPMTEFDPFSVIYPALEAPQSRRWSVVV